MCAAVQSDRVRNQRHKEERHQSTDLTLNLDKSGVTRSEACYLTFYPVILTVTVMFRKLPVTPLPSPLLHLPDPNLVLYLEVWLQCRASMDSQAFRRDYRNKTFAIRCSSVQTDGYYAMALLCCSTKPLMQQRFPPDE